MANFDFSLVGGLEEPEKEDNIPLTQINGESELAFYNRKAVALAKELMHDNRQGKELEDFLEDVKAFQKEWREVIDRDPLIGKKE